MTLIGQFGHAAIEMGKRLGPGFFMAVELRFEDRSGIVDISAPQQESMRSAAALLIQLYGDLLAAVFVS